MKIDIKFDSVQFDEALRDALNLSVVADMKRRMDREVARAFGIPPSLIAPPHPMCRCTKEEPVYEQDQKPAKKIRNKFYIAAPAMASEREQAADHVDGETPGLNDGTYRPELGRHSYHEGLWTRKDIKDCIKQAERMLETNRDMDAVHIVKIVKVVRRRKLPVIVEDVK